MIGPYTAYVFLNGGHGHQDMELNFEEMYYADGTGENTVFNGHFNTSPHSEAAKNVSRFYRDGASATLAGTTRLAAFYIGALLDAGEEARIEIVGTHGGFAATGDSVWVSRDAAGRMITDLGSRVGTERHFRGV